MILVSADIGNGFVKARSRERACTFPSVVAREGGAIRFDAGLADDQLKNIVIEFEGETFAVGEAAYRMARIQALDMGRDRVTHDIYRRLFAAALATTVRRSDQLAVVASLPVEWYNGGREEARRALSGVWQVGYAGQVLNYYIDESDMHIVPEGFGALCSVLLSPTGKGQYDGLATQTVGVIDIGTRTTDLLFFDHLELHPNMSDGFDRVGMSICWASLKAQINLEHGRSLTPRELDNALANGYFDQGNQRVSIMAEIERARQDLADAIRAHVDSMWAAGQAVNTLLVTGGGAWLVYDLLPYDHKLKVDNAYFANCEGGFRFGLRRGFAHDQG